MTAEDWKRAEQALNLFHPIQLKADGKAYGSEIHTLLGQAVSRDILESELRRFIIEALMVNPYIVELNGFRFEFSRAGVTVYFDCTTVYGEMRQSYVYEGGV